MKAIVTDTQVVEVMKKRRTIAGAIGLIDEMKDDADLPCQLQSIRLDQLGLQGPLQQPTCSREDDERHHAKAGSQPGRYRWMAPGHRASVSSPRSSSRT